MAGTRRHAELRRYPFADLLAVMDCSNNEARRRLRCSGSTWNEYRDRGVTAQVAHTLADKAGVHAWDVWPDLRDDEIDAVTVECARDGCQTRFVPTHSEHRYCRPPCQAAVKAADAAWRANRAANARQWRARNAARVNAARRARYAGDVAHRETRQAHANDSYSRNRDSVRARQNTRRRQDPAA